MRKLAWIVTLTALATSPLLAQTTTPDLRGTWKGVSESIVLGGGNAKRLDELPPRTFPGDNQNAREGGFRLWRPPTARAKVSAAP